MLTKNNACAKNSLSKWFVCILFGILTACTSTPTKVQQVISEVGNEEEWNKVIRHYKLTGEKEKLKAFYFLMGHINYQQHWRGEGIDNYDQVFEEMVQTSESQKEWLSDIFDSLVIARDIRLPGETIPVRDYSILKAENLINHIDAAFRAWEQPWAKELTFEAFCEYILPYKLLQETPENWMSDVQEKFSHLVLDTEDMYEACLVINDELKKQFKIRTVPTYSDLSFSQLHRIKSGKCHQAAQYTAYVMRSFGIPITVDYGYWGNMNGVHEWNALIYNGKPIPFVGSESDPGKTKVDLALQRKRSKIFRHTYNIQKQELQYEAYSMEEIPEQFRSYHILDVTAEYIPVSDIAVQLEQKTENQYLYLCTFNRQEWSPVYWGKVGVDNVVFKNMGRGILYLPMRYNSPYMEAISNPIILHQDGKIEHIEYSSSAHIAVDITKKSPRGPSIIQGTQYELLYWDNIWVSVGEKIATENNKITFEGIPQGALLWIRSMDKSYQERPFLYKHGEQIWY